VAILPNNWVAWVGTSIPAGQTNDAELLNRDRETSFNASFIEADALFGMELFIDSLNSTQF
jgi:hypothetical protein